MYNLGSGHNWVQVRIERRSELGAKCIVWVQVIIGRRWKLSAGKNWTKVYNLGSGHNWVQV